MSNTFDEKVLSPFKSTNPLKSWQKWFNGANGNQGSFNLFLWITRGERKIKG